MAVDRKVGLLLTALACGAGGCFLISEKEHVEPIPVQDEGCSDDHAEMWSPSDEGAEIVIEGRLANRSCNQMPHFQGGGGQGGDVFHIEPIFRITNPERVPEEPSITWEFYDLETDEFLGSQGFEIYADDMVETDDGLEFHVRLFIGSAERGNNLRLQAIAFLPTNGGTDVETRASAAVYVLPVPE